MVPVWCNALQHTATHCNTLPTHCSTLQRTILAAEEEEATTNIMTNTNTMTNTSLYCVPVSFVRQYVCCVCLFVFFLDMEVAMATSILYCVTCWFVRQYACFVYLFYSILVSFDMQCVSVYSQLLLLRVVMVLLVRLCVSMSLLYVSFVCLFCMSLLMSTCLF